MNRLPSDEISFTVPDEEEGLAAVIEAIYESNPCEEPVMSTRFKYGSAVDNPNKWWQRPET